MTWSKTEGNAHAVQSGQYRALKDQRAKALLESEAEEYGESTAFSVFLCDSGAVLQGTNKKKGWRGFKTRYLTWQI